MVVGASFGAVKFENQFVRWQIGDDAKVSTMVEKSTGRELVGEKTAFVAIVGDDGVLREATRRYAASAPEIKRVWNGEDVFLPEGDGMTIFFL